MRRSIFVLISGLLVGLLFGWLGFKFLKLSDRTIINRLSPDDNLRIRLIERLPDFDRQFYLELERIDEKPKIIYQSRNENYPAGSERIIWSSDSSRFILVGRHFNVRISGNDVFLSTGEYIYLMYEITSGQLLCNTYVPDWCDVGPKQIKTSSGYYTTTREPIITIDDLLQYEWESPLIEARPILSPAKK